MLNPHSETSRSTDSAVTRVENRKIFCPFI